MSRGNPLITALFWLMYLVGFGSICLALYLPAWLEQRQLHRTLAERERVVAELEARRTTLDVQIEHRRTDPAYVERLARKEFGVTTPGRESVVIETADAEEPAGETQAATQTNTTGRIESTIETAAQTHPLLSLYTQDRTRPYVLGFSLALAIAALACLGRSANATPTGPGERV